MLIDGQMKKDSNALGLGRILVNALVVRGTQLSILAKIDDDIMIKIHCDLITWAVTKIAEGDENANTPSKAFVAFKVLSFFIIGMGSQDAATMYVDSLFADEKWFRNNVHNLLLLQR